MRKDALTNGRTCCKSTAENSPCVSQRGQPLSITHSQSALVHSPTRATPSASGYSTREGTTRTQRYNVGTAHTSNLSILSFRWRGPAMSPSSFPPFATIPKEEPLLLFLPPFPDETVDEAAIDGFKRLSASLSPGCATALAFHHIPMQEMAGLEPLRGHSGIFDAAVRAGMAPWWASLLAPIIRLLPQRLVVGSSKKPSSLFEALCEAKIPAGDNRLVARELDLIPSCLPRLANDG